MRRRHAIGLLMLALSAPAIAGPPEISSSYPTSFMAIGPDARLRVGGIAGITLKGRNLAADNTTGFTVERDIQVYMRKGPGQWTLARRPGNGSLYSTAWSGSAAGLQFIAAEWITNPGYLEFRVVVRGQASNVFRVPVLPQPAAAPVFTSISRKLYSTEAGERDWSYRIVGRNFTPGIQVRVDGQSVGAAWINLEQGVFDAEIPAALRARPGHYAVQLETFRGLSGRQWIDIVAPPRVVAVQPERVVRTVPAAAGTTPKTAPAPTFRVKVRYEGSDPDQVLVRAHGGIWLPPVSQVAHAGEATVELPAGLRKESGKLEIRLRNRVGTAIATVEVYDTRPMMPQRSELKPGIPAVARPVPGRAKAPLRNAGAGLKAGAQPTVEHPSGAGAVVVPVEH